MHSYLKQQSPTCVLYFPVIAFVDVIDVIYVIMIMAIQ